MGKGNMSARFPRNIIPHISDFYSALFLPHIEYLMVVIRCFIILCIGDICNEVSNNGRYVNEY